MMKKAILHARRHLVYLRHKMRKIFLEEKKLRDEEKKTKLEIAKIEKILREMERTR